MEIKKFEDIIAWQKAREVVKEIYRITTNEMFSKDYGLKDQIQRAGVSIMSNIAEGYERGTKEEFIQFLYIAKGSCGEVRSQLYVAYDLGYISLHEFQKLQKLTTEVSRLIYHFIEYLKTARIRGQKFKKPSVKSFKEEIEELLKSFQSSSTLETPSTTETSETTETVETSEASEISDETNKSDEI